MDADIFADLDQQSWNNLKEDENKIRELAHSYVKLLSGMQVDIPESTALVIRVDDVEVRRILLNAN